jgi:hypothetical protein
MCNQSTVNNNSRKFIISSEKGQFYRSKQLIDLYQTNRKSMLLYSIQSKRYRYTDWPYNQSTFVNKSRRKHLQRVIDDIGQIVS